jgi:hypothetical protein
LLAEEIDSPNKPLLNDRPALYPVLIVKGNGGALLRRCQADVSGHRYARFRGLTAVPCQCMLAAAAQTLKKLALALTKKAPPA